MVSVRFRAEQRGWSVIECGTPRLAMRELLTHRPDVLVTVATGEIGPVVRLISAARRLGCAGMIVAVMEEADVATERQAREAGADAVLLSPEDWDQLDDMIDRAEGAGGAKRFWTTSTTPRFDSRQHFCSDGSCRRPGNVPGQPPLEWFLRESPFRFSTHRGSPVPGESQ